MSSYRIHSLPPDVAAKVKSSTSITHLNGVVVELVKNALDANAHTIFVTVDYQRGGCVVEDDGDGIPPVEFETGGGLGKAHHTSKFGSNTDIYGRRGSFLSSLSSLALLTITSHHVHHPSTNTIIFHHSIPVARLIPAPVHQGLRFSGHGTSVTVNDLFGNMPVRVRNRALILQKPDELERRWDELRYFLVSFMIANKQLLKLVLSDVDKDRKLTIHPRNQGIRGGSEPDLQRITLAFSQAGLIGFQNHERWHIASASAPHVSIWAALSLVPSPTRKVQFISFGIDPVFPRNHANILYSEVNRLFSLSDFGAAGSFTAADDALRDPSMKAIPKSVNKWPMFYICINTTYTRIDDEDLPESDKSLQRIIDVLTAMINEYLLQHNLRPRTQKRKREEPSPQGDRRPRDDDSATGLNTVSGTELELGGQLKLPSFSRPITSPHFGNWSRVKGGKSHASQRKFHTGSTHAPASTDQRSLENHTAPLALEMSPRLKGAPRFTAGSLTSIPQQQLKSVPSAQNPHMSDMETDTLIPWTDPYTGRSYWVNSRTGQSINPQSWEAVTLPMRPRSTGYLTNVRIANRAKRPSSATLDMTQSTWIDTVLDNWKNPIFGRSEQPINSLDIIEKYEERSLEARKRHVSRKLCGLDSFGASRFRGKLRKQDLIAAKVISQVDQKFILLKLNNMVSKDLHGMLGSTLVLIDQHAADERCRVESLFEQLFQVGICRQSVQTIAVDPIVFGIPTAEVRLLNKHAEFFSLWGVEYLVELRDTEASVTVNRLPSLIAERCRTEPDLVIGLIRGEIWKREESGGQPRVPSRLAEANSGKIDSWVDRIAGCPEGILALLNSRACRTAIMFNDTLSTDECRTLVQQLTSCVLPFQCAHGRPSMVPILDLRAPFDADPPYEYASTSRGEDPGFIKMFKRWQSISNT